MVGIYRLKPVAFRVAGGAHVIKANDFATLETAESLIAAAEVEAASIVANAQAAYEAERQRGFEEGLQQARLEAMTRLLEETAELDRNLVAVEADLSRLVVNAVKKILADFDNESRAEAVVKAALNQMRREKRAELLVPPSLGEAMRERIGAIVAQFPDVELVEVTVDPSLGEDQIVLQSAIGRVDGTLNERIEELETIIRTTHARLSADALDFIGQGGRHEPD